MSTRTVLVLFLISIIASHAMTKSIIPKETTSFQMELFNTLSSENVDTNLIISPFSIQSALTLLYMGAEGRTAKEFQTLLQYHTSNKLETAENFLHIKNSILTSSSNLVQIQSANRIYTRFDLVPEYNEKVSKYFGAEAEKVDFRLKEETAKKINTWVEEQTNKKIQNLITPNAIDDYTTAILVNAIYFKAQWADQFAKHMTKKQPFYVNDGQKIDVDTMSGDITCKYAKIPDFDATAIELQYLDTDLVMDIILPNQIKGLKMLENRISVSGLNRIFENITEEEVDVRLPKFKIEFETGLIPVLTKMGMKESFSYGANFSGLFKERVPVKISDVIHKAFIEVNEYGSEAAAATYPKLVFLSAHYGPSARFIANHPFMFVIRNKNLAFFMGHVKNFES